MSVRGRGTEEPPEANAASHHLGSQISGNVRWPGSFFHPTELGVAPSDSRGPLASLSPSPALAMTDLLCMSGPVP